MPLRIFQLEVFTSTTSFSPRACSLGIDECSIGITFHKRSEEHTIKKRLFSRNLRWLESESSSELEHTEVVVLCHYLANDATDLPSTAAKNSALASQLILADSLHTYSIVPPSPWILSNLCAFVYTSSSYLTFFFLTFK